MNKSINIKIPISMAQQMDDKAQLNAQWLTSFIEDYLPTANLLKPIQGLTYNYSFKIDKTAHKAIKLKALECDLPMNEMLGRIVAENYHG